MFWRCSPLPHCDSTLSLFPLPTPIFTTTVFFPPSIFKRHFLASHTVPSTFAFLRTTKPFLDCPIRLSLPHLQCLARATNSFLRNLFTHVLRLHDTSDDFSSNQRTLGSASDPNMSDEYATHRWDHITTSNVTLQTWTMLLHGPFNTLSQPNSLQHQACIFSLVRL